MGVEVPTPAAAALRLASSLASFFFLSLLKAHICIKTTNKSGHVGNNNKASKSANKDKDRNEKGTDVTLKGLGAKLKFEQLQCTKWGMKAIEEVAYFPLLREKVLKTPGLLEVWLLRPVERVPLIASHLEEVFLEPLVRLLEEC